GQDRLPKESSVSFDHLPLLLKDGGLRKQIEIREEGILLKGIEGQKDWFIHKEEYASTKSLFSHHSSADILKLLEQKGTSPWNDSIVTHAQLLPQKKVLADSAKVLPLAGIKVALDPGHIAANMEIAELEGKYVKMAPSSSNQQERIEFFEARLNLATAHLIREELEEMGAKVLMTRSEGGISTFGMDYWTWKEEKWDSTLKTAELNGDLSEEQARYYRSKAPEDKIFNHFYVREDLRNRAKLVNEFAPDLTIIIHYNVHAPNWMKRNDAGEFTPTEANYAMAFVPGAFMEGELDQELDRVDFLRLLLFPEDVYASIRLSDLFLKYSKDLTGVERVKEAEGLSYLDKACVLTDYQGVYARNLSLSRMIKGPLVYGESLCQDNAAESLMLNKKELEVEGIWVSDRVKAVAESYVKAVRDYIRKS
ncbi:MAG: hypothetical protein AAF696_01530, partial [Bacteroidota bacterium]